MKILIYAPEAVKMKSLTEAVVRVGIQADRLEQCGKAHDLQQRLGLSRQWDRLLILCPKSLKNLREIISFKDLLAGLKIILVLPERKPSIVGESCKLSPRFTVFADEGFYELALVVRKMSDNYSGRSDAQQTMDTR